MDRMVSNYLSSCNLNKTTLGVIKEWPSIYILLRSCEKDVKSNRWPKPPTCGGYKCFGDDDLTAKHCYFRCLRPSDVDGIKILIKMTWPQNIKIHRTMFAAWSSLSKF